MEKFLSVEVGQLQFIDSMQFAGNASLESLVKTLNENDFRYMKEAFPNEQQFQLVKSKQIFPYDFFDSPEKLKYKQFPEREKFFNTLSDKECTEKNYLHGKQVWNTFKCKTFEDYHDLYLKTDVLLLADFFENFRETCLENYGLDACHYYSAPGLAWDAALKMSKIKLQLFDNEEMYTFMERSIRGGVSMITKRHAKANNPECRNYNPNKDNSHLIYLDANNLYGWAMSQYLPTHGFEWMKENDIEKLDINSIPQDGEDGFIFEVDLDYPMELHDLHNDYPLAPERLTIDESMLSPFQWERFPDY